jgi:hypothetical protein
MQNSSRNLSRASPFAIRVRSSVSSGTNRTNRFSSALSCRNGTHRPLNTGTRALRSQASIGERGGPGEFLNVPRGGATGERAHSKLNPTRRSGNRFFGSTWARQGCAPPHRARDPPGALPLIAITGATGVGTTLHRLTYGFSCGAAMIAASAVGCKPCSAAMRPSPSLTIRGRFGDLRRSFQHVDGDQRYPSPPDGEREALK